MWRETFIFQASWAWYCKVRSNTLQESPHNIIIIFTFQRSWRASFSSVCFHYLSEWLALNWSSMNICQVFKNIVIGVRSVFIKTFKYKEMISICLIKYHLCLWMPWRFWKWHISRQNSVHHVKCSLYFSNYLGTVIPRLESHREQSYFEQFQPEIMIKFGSPWHWTRIVVTYSELGEMVLRCILCFPDTVVLYPSSMEDMIQEPQCVPKTANSTKPYLLCFFHIYIYTYDKV